MALNLNLIMFCVGFCFTCHADSSGKTLFPCRQDSGERGYCVAPQDCPTAPPQDYNECPGEICCRTADYFKSLRFNKIKEQCSKEYKIAIDPTGIFGGVRSLAAELPHMAVLGYQQANETLWGCGGSLISENYVLTAAHCISSRDFGDVHIVRVGDLNLKSTEDEAEPQDIKVKRRIKHPNYKPPLKYNDIALLELENPARITFFVRPACLNTETEIQDKPWIASGWGNLQFQGESAEHLQKAELREYKFNECTNYYNKTERKLNKGIDDATQICAGHEARDTCQGDSGGPLQFFSYKYNLYTIIGVTSFGKACGISRSPGVYTRVSAYAKWIESIVWPELQ